MNKKHFQTVTQAVGTITLVLLAIYGLLAAIGVATPIVSADDQRIATPGDAEVTDGLNGRAAASNPTVPPYFNYEGTLREADGSLTNGTVDIRAVIYDAPTNGTVLYVEDFDNVSVRDGQFNIVIGENPSGAYSLLTAFETAPLYMGINVDSTGEIIPRERVHGVPWSIYAQNAENSFDGVPVGGIIDWYRPTQRWNGFAWEAIPTDELLPIPDGYLPCDGRGYDDPLGTSPLDRTALPDLRYKFTYGAGNLDEIGQTGGTTSHSHTTSTAGSHNHNVFESEPNPDAPGEIKQYSYDEFGNKYWDVRWFGDGVGFEGGSAFYFGGRMNQTGYRIWGTSNDGAHSHTVSTADHMPPFVRVMKLCRTH